MIEKLDESEPEFVTVSELADRLGISPRQASRWMSRVADADKDTTDARQSRVRLGAVVALRATVTRRSQGSRAGVSPSTSETDAPNVATVIGQSRGGHEAVISETEGGHATVTLEQVRLELEIEKRRAAVAEAERDGLKERLADTQAERDRLSRNLDEALAIARAAQDQERAGRLLGSGRTVQQIEASGLTGGDSSGDSGMGVGIVPPDSGTRPWWAFWKARG